MWNLLARKAFLQFSLLWGIADMPGIATLQTHQAMICKPTTFMLWNVRPLSLKTEFKEFENLATNQCSLLRMKAQNGLLCLDTQMAMAGENYFFSMVLKTPICLIFPPFCNLLFGIWFA